MEPKNGGLVHMIFILNWVIFRFQSLIFQGVAAWRYFSQLRFGHHEKHECEVKNKPGAKEESSS